MDHPDVTNRLDAITRSVGSLTVTLPRTAGPLPQDEEWFEYELAGRTRRLRLHDYREIYQTPGLYESLVYRTLECRSPERVLRPLESELADHGETLRGLRILDLGAGNGVVGELLRRSGAGRLLGVDILPEAERATRRDRPGTYDDYLVTDLTSPSEEAERRLRAFAPNALVVVAALGFGDIPPAAFQRTFDLLPPGGWLAMCIKDSFLQEGDRSGFGRLLRRLVAEGRMTLLRKETYVHRLSVSGDELHYVAVIARKRQVPPLLTDDSIESANDAN